MATPYDIAGGRGCFETALRDKRGKFTRINWRKDDRAIAVVILFNLLLCVSGIGDKRVDALRGFVIIFTKWFYEQSKTKANEPVWPHAWMCQVFFVFRPIKMRRDMAVANVLCLPFCGNEFCLAIA
ncbi:hypothetical protein D3C87_1616130 [compost metagenome]